ncbi:hypothetical protein SO078_29235 (plasmid) [Sinorhizobium meliloti]|uniref:hypothetical protein n=1 Tax=Rhizobium meliloti TaxID=382 RepID=UPI002D771790|nr:hypothetical protein [Sinorhizobium meliloti]WRQ71314.1 hypothetical protein SO078_29235 [Sinorhizobium meliloti]
MSATNIRPLTPSARRDLLAAYRPSGMLNGRLAGSGNEVDVRTADISDKVGRVIPHANFVTFEKNARSWVSAETN